MRTVVAVILLAAWLVGAEWNDHARADEKPAPGKGYELRIVAVGEIYHGIRFKPTTGESWMMLNGRWEKLAEDAVPPAGDYEITIIPAESLLAVRLDRATGTTWLLAKKKWIAVKEPAPKRDAPAAKPPGPGCALRHIVLGDQLHVVRFHTKTGATWHLGGDTFEPLAEFDKVPAGDFDITLIAGKKDWMGFRLDRKNGTTWILQANLWQVVTEPE
jgi:hypothetical protein